MKNKLKTLVVGFVILLAVQFVSNYITTFLHLSFPAPIIGMLILTCILYFKIIPAKLLRRTCTALLKYMPMFFIPLFVGIISYYHIIKSNLASLLTIIFVTTFLTMLTTGWVVQFIINKTCNEKTDGGVE